MSSLPLLLNACYPKTYHAENHRCVLPVGCCTSFLLPKSNTRSSWGARFFPHQVLLAFCFEKPNAGFFPFRFQTQILDLIRNCGTFPHNWSFGGSLIEINIQPCAANGVDPDHCSNVPWYRQITDVAYCSLSTWSKVLFSNEHTVKNVGKSWKCIS